MIDYEFYYSSFMGETIPAKDWNAYEALASAQMKRYKRIYRVTEPEENAEAMAICAMAEALYGFDLIANGEGGPVNSASIGSVSVSYANSSMVDISPRGQSKALYKAASLYVDIYRG